MRRPEIATTELGIGVVSGFTRLVIAVRACTSRYEVTSGSSPVVGLEHATESFVALNLCRNGIDIITRIDELIAEALMVPLGMIMLDVFTNCVLK